MPHSSNTYYHIPNQKPIFQGKSFKKIQTGSLKQQYPQAGTGNVIQLYIRVSVVLS